MDKRERIRRNLFELYGDAVGAENYEYLTKALEAFLRRRAEKSGTAAIAEASDSGAEPFSRLAGKVFAICYPDNVYNDIDPTLKTLSQTLAEYFPAINGIHILPERVMSHDDLWPQDLHALLCADLAVDLVEHLIQCGVLADDRRISGGGAEEDVEQCLLGWYEEHSGNISASKDEFLLGMAELIENRRKSHFNDGGFSQITRAKLDPRFGDVDDLEKLSGQYALMLDFVVNHLDIDNETLEGYRRGENDGSAFIIISPQDYERLKRSGDLAKTFRPRPFPLFTGLRKYPPSAGASKSGSLEKMNGAFQEAGLSPPDERAMWFLSVYFKVQNDQGLSSEDRGLVDDFIGCLSEEGADPGIIFGESEIQEGQPALTPAAAAGMAAFCELAGLDGRCAEVFELNDDEIFGPKFFIYTTFSESQADLNPVSQAGFRLIVDDLVHLLGSGDLVMMRMDAVKYLWKKIGERNFDMEDGDKLIEVIRLFLALAVPEMIPLDEVNSSDQDVYRMGRDGGFAYLFGQVNALPAAFNSHSLRPLERLTSTMRASCPENLLLFVMLSTHDGRSIQGIGVDRSDGHVSIREFSDLRKTCEAAGGKVKYRSVPPGIVPADTFYKACGEMGADPSDLGDIFRRDGEEFELVDKTFGRDDFLTAVSGKTGKNFDDPDVCSAAFFLADWVITGRAPYELCCTSRAAFDPVGSDGRSVSPEEEARRLALAQVFVLSFGQSVPAIYFNDLLGLGNDIAGYTRSGKPRDLNRHKSHVDEIKRSLTGDPFTKEYVALLNSAIAARAEDPAFHPGSHGYEFISLGYSVFLNHVFFNSHHSLVIGNTAPGEVQVVMDLSEIMQLSEESLFNDRLTGKTYHPAGGVIELHLPAYGGVWLSS